MRIIAGQGGSRRLRAPRGRGTRPTADRVREALFNVLAPRLEGSRFLDLFAGSGGVGLEALSRGAAEVFFIEKSPEAVEIIRRNIQDLKLAGRKMVYRMDVAAFIKRRSSEWGVFDIVFLDPPYKQGYEVQTLNGIAKSGLLSDNGVAVVESARDDVPPERVESFVLRKRRYYGDTALSFYQMGEA